MEIEVPKGQRTRVLYLWSSSIPGTVRFTADTASGRPPSGKIETVIRRFIVPETTEYQLAADNRLSKGFLDVNYQVWVTPDEDVTITFATRHFRAHHTFWVFVAVLAFGVAGAILPFMIQALSE